MLSKITKVDMSGKTSYEIPLLLTSRALVTLKGPAVVPVPPAGTMDDYEKSNKAGFEVLNWGTNNDFPQLAELDISSNPVLQRALEMRSMVTIGQGVHAVRVTGFTETGEEILEAINDPELLKILNSAWVARYLSEAARDMFKFGTAWVQFRPAMDGKSFRKISVTNAMHCRLLYPDAKTGICKQVLLNGMWPEGTEVTAYTLLSEHDADEELAVLVDRSKPVFFQIHSPFSSNPYYTYPSWLAAKKAGWLDVSNKTAKLINASLDNYASSFLHIQIPYEYWDRKYPESDYSKGERLEKINTDIRGLETSLTSVENARAALTTFFDSDNMNTKVSIEVKEFKINTEALQNNTAGDIQIAIAAGLQPDIMGLMFGNSKGGSMQREILLLLYALSYSDRNRILEPLELLLKGMNAAWQDMELRIRQTFLTTLDTGAGSKTVS